MDIPRKVECRSPSPWQVPGSGYALGAGCGPDGAAPVLTGLLGGRVKGLRLQMALFYVLLSLPALLLIERAVFGWKFENLLQQLDDGRVERFLQTEALALESAIAAGARREELQLRLQHLVLRLERPRESLGTSAVFVLLELAPHPFHARLPMGDGDALVAGAAHPAEAGWVRRTWSQELPIRQGRDPSRIEVQLAVPSPWRPSLESISFEWRLAVAYLVIFLVASAGFLRVRVLGRVSRMARAAGAWARGDFSVVLRDRSQDELGRLAQSLDQMAADVQALVRARAQLASLEERQRLARDLHDTVKQKAFALSLQLAAAGDSADAAQRAQRLGEAQMLMAEIQRELAELLQEMRAPVLLVAEGGTAVDLAAVIGMRVSDFSRRSSLACTVNLPAALEVPSDVADVALRVLDEALTNVWKHALAATVEIALTCEQGAWCLRVDDDGRGFERPHAGGMGLGNMRERADSIGARFSVEHSLGQGTRVLLVLPRQESPQ